jgi:hypothetical protein
MATEMGEYLVGAYLKLVLGCGVVDFNPRPPGAHATGSGWAVGKLPSIRLRVDTVEKRRQTTDCNVCG